MWCERMLGPLDRRHREDHDLRVRGSTPAVKSSDRWRALSALCGGQGWPMTRPPRAAAPRIATVGRSSLGDRHLQLGDPGSIGSHLVVQLAAVSSEAIAAGIYPADQSLVDLNDAFHAPSVNDRRHLDHG
jgi:hypothetical protein